MKGKADTAVLFIHGILGIPDYFAPFWPLVPGDWSVCNMLLKGHGGSVRDFSAASMDEWKQQVEKTLQALLESHERIVIVAHSMGTLFAIQQALEKPVAALFLIHVPLKVRIRPELFRISWKVFWGTVRPDDKWALAAERAYGMERDWHILRYLGWIPRYLELFSEIRRTGKMAHRLAVPCQAYLSVLDEMVSPKAGRVFAGNPYVTLTMLEESGHFYCSPEAWKLLLDDFRLLVRRIQAGEI